jgi:hypothetical protein
MSVALYIVWEKRVSGLDDCVNGKALPHAGKVLDALADKAGTKPLMKFFSASPEELSEFASGHGVEVEENAMLFPPEQWFLQMRVW